jgi:hypothetical protein
VSKAIDREAGAVREATGEQKLTGTARIKGGSGRQVEATAGKYKTAEIRSSIEVFDAPATPEAAQWQGWGTTMKPAFEPVIVARKPVEDVVEIQPEHCVYTQPLEDAYILTPTTTHEQRVELFKWLSEHAE